MAAHFTLDVGPVGDGSTVVNGDDVSALIAGSDLSVRPGQPTTLTLHLLGSATIEGEGIVTCVRDASAAEIHAELVDLLAGLVDGADDLWTAAMQRPEAGQAGGPARAFLLTIIDALTVDA